MSITHKNVKHQGFTLVELLVVIVVIAVLASISVAAYTNVRGRALESRLLSEMTQIRKEMEIYKIQNDALPVTLNGDTATRTYIQARISGQINSSGSSSSSPIDGQELRCYYANVKGMKKYVGISTTKQSAFFIDMDEDENGEFPVQPNKKCFS